MIVHLGVRTLTAGSNGVHAPGAAQHQTIGGTQAGDHHKQVENITEHTAKNIGKGNGCALFDELLAKGITLLDTREGTKFTIE